MKVNEEIYSIKSSLLDDDMLKQKRKNERYGTIIAILAQFMWALNGIQLKSYKTLFPEQYRLNNFIFWRSIPIWLLGYIFCKRKNIKITPHREIQNLFWFFARSFGNYVCVILWILFLMFFRCSTCQCVAGCSPIFLIYMSIFLLKESFYMRYLYGVLICIAGNWIIILNEKKNKKEQNNSDSEMSNGNIFMGIIVAIVYLAVVTINIFGQKILCKEKIKADVQNYYLGMYNTLPALLVTILFEREFGFSSILYILYSLSNGFVFTLGNYLTAIALENLSMVRYVPASYTCIVFTYFLGFIFLGEKVYFTDILGSGIILGFQVYNTVYPVGKQAVNESKNKENENSPKIQNVES